MNTATNLTIARRKGNKVRLWNPDTAVMSGWVPLVAEQQRKAGRPRKTTSKRPSAETLGKMRKSELQALADTRGIKYNTKTTNAALVAALSA